MTFCNDMMESSIIDMSHAYGGTADTIRIGNDEGNLSVGRERAVQGIVTTQVNNGSGVAGRLNPECQRKIASPKCERLRIYDDLASAIKAKAWPI